MGEPQILKPEDTKQIRPIDVVALKLLHQFSGSQHPKNLGMKRNTPIQRRILKENREYIKKKEFDPTKDQESRKKFLEMF